MPNRFESLCCLLYLVVAASAAGATDGRAVARLGPSDCKPRDADSTCAKAVAGATVVTPPFTAELPLYDGPLGGVPAFGYAYWGFDFIANETATPSPVRPDQFINRSNVPVTITLSFTFPTTHACNRNCLPGVQFQVDVGWRKLDPPFVIHGNTASVTAEFAPGRGYGWVIGLWQSSNARLTVTVPKGSAATLREVGLPMLPALAKELPAMIGSCTCADGTSATCSDGTHFSNGLLGAWTQNFETYVRAGAFNNCPIDH